MVVVVAVMAAGCAASEDDGAGGGDRTEAGGGTSVVAGFYPLAEVAERVGGDRVAVTNITPPGVEPHDLEMAPDQVAEIQTADVVLYLDQGFQPAVEEVVGEARGATVDLLEGLDLLPGVEGEHEDDDAAGGEEHGVVDEHIWLDPVLMMDVTDRVAEVLGRADPAGADTFDANARALREELTGLDEAFREGLSDCERDTVVVSHAAFRYLTDRYGLHQEAISGLSPEAEPDPARLAELAELVRREGVTVIFTEELVSPEVAETLAREAGVGTEVLSPLEGLTEEQIAAGDDYVSVMEENLSKLRTALGCA